MREGYFAARVERFSFDGGGEASRFYARVGGKWSFDGEETALAIQLRSAALESAVLETITLREIDALTHLRAARALLRQGRDVVRGEARRSAEPVGDSEL